MPVASIVLGRCHLVRLVLVRTVVSLRSLQAAARSALVRRRNSGMSSWHMEPTLLHPHLDADTLRHSALVAPGGVAQHVHEVIDIDLDRHLVVYCGVVSPPADRHRGRPLADAGLLPALE